MALYLIYQLSFFILLTNTFLENHHRMLQINWTFFQVPNIHLLSQHRPEQFDSSSHYLYRSGIGLHGLWWVFASFIVLLLLLSLPYPGTIDLHLFKCHKANSHSLFVGTMVLSRDPRIHHWLIYGLKIEVSNQWKWHKNCRSSMTRPLLDKIWYDKISKCDKTFTRLLCFGEKNVRLTLLSCIDLLVAHRNVFLYI